MKHLQTYEGRNTMYWYGRSLKTDDFEDILTEYYKLINNPNVESIKVFDFVEIKTSKNYNFCIYISKEEKDKNFKGWPQLNDEHFKKFRRIGNEYTDEEIDDWLDDWDVRNTTNKYNL